MYRRYRRPSMWREMDRLQREMNRLFDTSFSRGTRTPTGYPALNIWTSEEDAVITAEVPGLDPEDLEISVMGETLTLSGERKPDDLPEGARYHRRERGYGRFTRSVQLPFQVDADNVEASFEHGVLTIHLPRSEEEKPRKIAVQAG